VRLGGEMEGGRATRGRRVSASYGLYSEARPSGEWWSSPVNSFCASRKVDPLAVLVNLCCLAVVYQMRIFGGEADRDPNRDGKCSHGVPSDDVSHPRSRLPGSASPPMPVPDFEMPLGVSPFREWHCETWCHFLSLREGHDGQAVAL